MKNINKLIALLVLVCTLVCSMVSCDIIKGLLPGDGPDEPPKNEWVDYASQLKLDLNTPTLKWEVTVKNHIDGDTTHFYVKSSGNINNISKTPGIDGVLKARYLGINTPESTGKIEPWGKAASNFTKERVMNAESIIIESNDDKWNVDSTGERFLVWVWYKAPGATDYKCLNVEILQEGLANSSKSEGFIYSQACENAVGQAADARKYVYAPATEKDPDFPYGEAQFMTLKELKVNITDYIGQRVAFEGVIVQNSGGSVFIESYDEIDNVYYGISAYYQTSGLDGFGLELLVVGNKLRFAGVVGEFSGSYQITDLKYDVWDTSNSKNMSLISEGNAAGYPEITPNHFDDHKNQGLVEVEKLVDGEEKTVELPYMFLCQDASVSMKNLKVVSTYTTKKGDSKGAITLYCKVDGYDREIQVRTIVLRDEAGNVIPESTFIGKTIDVKGTIDYYLPEGEEVGFYQIQLYSMDDVTFH